MSNQMAGGMMFVTPTSSRRQEPCRSTLTPDVLCMQAHIEGFAINRQGTGREKANADGAADDATPTPHLFPQAEHAITCHRQMAPRAAPPAVPRRPNNSSPNLDTTTACHDLHVITSAHSTDVDISRPSLLPVLSVLDALPVRPPPAHISPRRRDHVTPAFTSSEVTLYQCCAPPSARRSPKFGRMGLSKEQRIGILLAIDGIFFLIELTVGMFTNARLGVPSL
jgi:hypothetical protein